VRGGTTLDANVGDGISFAGAAGSVLDLGKTGDPGGIVFTKVATNHSAVHLLAAIQGFAVGETWMPSVQSANASGKYTAPQTFAAGAAGANVTVGPGGSLVVAQ